VVLQNKTTTHTDAQVQALHGAEAGINEMLGRLRSATTDGGVSGLSSLLPCFSTANPLTGTQSGSSTTSYGVSLNYYASDPLKLTTAGVLPAVLPCLAGTGPVDLVNHLAAIPGFARITSIGSGSAGGTTYTRSLSTTYAFNTANLYNPSSTSTAGGQLRFNPLTATSQPQCLDAGSFPATGTPLTIQPCGPLTSAAQVFSYNADLSLRLVSSVTALLPNGLCVNSLAPTAIVTLQPCLSLAKPVYNQQWSFDSNSAFGQTRPDGSRECLSVPVSVTPLSSVGVVGKACLTTYDPTASWLPTPSTGAGAAGAAMAQLVNLSQFGRCVQVTNQIVPSAAPNPFTILFPCEQASAPTNVDWYQKFGFNPTTGQWATVRPGDAQQYCLASTGQAGNYVTVAVCSSDPLQRWTDNGAALADQANASQWPYATRYTVVDSTGLCLSLSPTAGTAADWYVPANTTMQYSKITTDTCNGGPAQKWNADPNAQSASLRNTTEK
jgi:hypothetical protein